MGAVLTAAQQQLRAYLINNVPASGPWTPTNADLLTLFALIDGIVGGQMAPQTANKLAATGCTGSNVTQLNVATFENKSIMSVRSHWLTCSASALTLVYCNWSNWQNLGDYFDTGTNGYGTITGTCSVSYPTKGNVIGTGSFTVNPGQNAQVVVELSESIPAGAQFFVSTFATPASSCGIPVLELYQQNGYLYNYAAGEASEYATSGITDKTASPGTVNNANPTTTYIWGPTAILAQQPAAQPVIAVWGDSKQAGYKIALDAFGDLGTMTQAFALSTPSITFGCSGKPAGVDASTGYSGTGLATAMSLRLQLCELIGATHAINDYGRNDASASDTAAQIEGYITTIGQRQAAAGMVPWLVTQPPETTSTDSWATTANQTRVSWQGVIDTLNTWMRALPAPFVGVIDVMAAVGTALTGGKWNVPAWTLDGIHLAQPSVAPAIAQVNLNGFFAYVAAFAMGYADTYTLGVHSVQSALDFQMFENAVASGLTASTTHTLAGALQLTAGINQFSTVANAGDAATLPPMLPGQSVVIYNDGAHAMAVFPNTAAIAIDGGTAGASVTLTNAKRCRYTCLSATVIESAQLGVASA